MQELKDTQRREYNSNYLTAISAAMGQQTTGTQQTIGTTDTTGTTDTASHTTSTTGSGSSGSSGSSGGKKTTSGTTAAVNVRQVNGRYSPGNTSKIR